jgi:hypothetical protein
MAGSSKVIMQSKYSRAWTLNNQDNCNATVNWMGEISKACGFSNVIVGTENDQCPRDAQVPIGYRSGIGQINTPVVAHVVSLPDCHRMAA